MYIKYLYIKDIITFRNSSMRSSIEVHPEKRTMRWPACEGTSRC